MEIPEHVAEMLILRTANFYNLVNLDSFSGRDKTFLFPLRSVQTRSWGPRSLIVNGYLGLFTRENSGRDVKLTIHLHLKTRSRRVELYLHFIRFLSLMLN
jgi:hypothetical protein